MNETIAAIRLGVKLIEHVMAESAKRKAQTNVRPAIMSEKASEATIIVDAQIGDIVDEESTTDETDGAGQRKGQGQI